jgi:hypothetical protein
MSYIGNTPTTQSFISGTDYFNGNGSTTAFTLSRTVASVNDIQAVVNNVVQVPNDAYTISGTTITFTSAPSSGTNNVYVRYLSTTTQAITPSQGTVGTAQLGTITNIASGNTALTLQTGSTPTTAVTIDTSQNVGIGETSPAGSAGYTQLVVRGSSGAELSLKGGTTQYGYMYVDSGGFRIINPQSGASSGTLQFFTSNTERMRITSTGQLNLTRPTGDDTQIEFLRMQGGGVSAGDNLAFLSKYTTTVTTSTKAIFGGPLRGCIVIVTGYTGASYFSDILNCSSNAVSVISSQNSTGSPASRTYSITSFLLSLSMGSGTYNVGTLLLGTQPRE